MKRRFYDSFSPPPPTQGTLTVGEFLALEPFEKARLTVVVKQQDADLKGMPLNFSFDYSDSKKTTSDMIVSPKIADIQEFVNKFNMIGIKVNDAIDSVEDSNPLLSGFTQQFIRYDIIRNDHGIKAITAQRNAAAAEVKKINSELNTVNSQIPAAEEKVIQAQSILNNVNINVAAAAGSALISYVGTELELNDGRKFDGVLFRGFHNMKETEDSKSLVEQLQRDLQSLGYYNGDGQVPDGIYGKGTAAAVAKFQVDNGLNPDGRTGKETIAAIQLLQVKQAFDNRISNSSMENKEAALALKNFDGIIPQTIQKIMTDANITDVKNSDVVVVLPPPPNTGAALPVNTPFGLQKH
jgi:hypothetical protein